MRICSVEGCIKPTKTHKNTMCSMHMTRMVRHGSLEPFPTEKERFEEWIEPVPESGCWLWTGKILKNGYGRWSVSKTFQELTHRVSARIYIGDVPGDMLVLHKCDVRCCVNPQHLYFGTYKDNARDAIERGRFRPFGKKMNPRRAEPQE